MKGIYQLTIFVCSVVLFTASDWVSSHAQGILFTIGFLAIVIGFALAWLPLGFIVPGMMICGLLIWDSTAKLSAQSQEDAHD